MLGDFLLALLLLSLFAALAYVGHLATSETIDSEGGEPDEGKADV